jgi:hypothetical protein
MENQHRKISGYRELSQAEIDLMNEVKALGPQIEAVLAKVHDHLVRQKDAAHGMPEFAAMVGSQTDQDEAQAELARLKTAEPLRWAAIARTDLQTGLMALTRAVAQPTFF